MSIIDLAHDRAIIEADGTIRCRNCIDGRDYSKGCAPIKEISVGRDDLENHEQVYICDYCEKVI